MAADMTISDWARSVGISRQSAHEAIKRCAIPVTDGRVDALVATTLYRARTRIRSNTRQAEAAPAAAAAPASSPPASPGAPTAADHDLRRKAAEADMAELEARRKAGALMAVDPAERAAFEAFRELRDATFSAIRSASPQVLGLTEVREVQHLLEDALRAAYADFEARMQHRLAEAAKP